MSPSHTQTKAMVIVGLKRDETEEEFIPTTMANKPQRNMKTE